MPIAGQVTGRFCVEGTEVLRYRLSLPSWEERALPTECYERVASAAQGFCEGVLRSYAEQAYENCDAPDKRFRFAPFLYTLTGDVTYRDEALLSVRLEAVWRRRGESEPLAHAWDAHTWLVGTEESVLLPPEQAAQAFGVGTLNKRRCRHAVGVIREGDAVVLYTSSERQVLPKKKEKQEKKRKKQKHCKNITRNSEKLSG